MRGGQVANAGLPMPDGGLEHGEVFACCFDGCADLCGHLVDFSTMGAGSRTPTMGSCPVRGRPRFRRFFLVNIKSTPVSAFPQRIFSHEAASDAQRAVQRSGTIVTAQVLSGLHHRYVRI